MRFLSFGTLVLGLIAVFLEKFRGTISVSEDLRSNSALIAMVGLMLGLLGVSFLNRSFNKQTSLILVIGIFLNGLSFFLMRDGIYIFLFFPWIIGVIIFLRIIFALVHFISEKFHRAKNKL